MAEKSASPRASASLRSASPMVRTVGRARTVSAPIRTCSCAMVVPPEATGSRYLLLSYSRRAVTRDNDSSLSQKTSCPPPDRNGTLLLGEGVAVCRPGSDVSTSAARPTPGQLPDGDHLFRGQLSPGHQPV